MKRLVLTLTLSLLVFSLFAGVFAQKTLPNGMELVTKENHDNTAVGFYCFVKTGSVNEGAYLGKGISHYLEHLVSSGTTTYHTEAEYEALGKEMGAIVNAYTTDEVTAYHILADKINQDLALQLLAEQIQYCVFDTTEINREKQVILKEIVMRSTPPQAKIYQRSNELTFYNSNRRFPVIGYTELFKTITREDMMDYYKKRYAPNNMIFVSVGDFDAEEMLTKLVDTFTDFPRQQIEPAYLPAQPVRSGEHTIIEEFDITQPTVRLNTIISKADYADITALDTALDILFAKRQSPIRYKLMEELQLVTDVGAYINYSNNQPEGAVMIYFEAKDVNDIDEIRNIIDEELAKYAVSGMEKSDIQNIINRGKSYKLMTQPGVDRDCNMIGWNMVRYGVPDTFESSMKQLERLSVADMEAALAKHLLPRNRLNFYAVPKGSKTQLENSVITDVVKVDPEKIQLKKNLTLIHRVNTEKPLVKTVINLPMSSGYETPENVGSLDFMVNMAFQGSKKYDPLTLTEWLEDHAVNLKVNTYLTGTNISFKCLKDDLPEMKKIILDAINNPLFDEREIALNKEQYQADYNRSITDPGSLHGQFKDAILFPGQRNAVSLERRNEIRQNLTRQDLINLHKEYLQADKLIVTMFGDISREEAETFALDMQKNIPNKAIKGEISYPSVAELNDTYTNVYDSEQVNINLVYQAPALTSNEFAAVKVMELILSGSRGRLHKAVRGTRDLAYYAYGSYTYNKEAGYFTITSQTSIDKIDDLQHVLQDEAQKIMNEPVTQEEVDAAVAENTQLMKTYMTDSSMPGYMTYFEALGLGYDYLTESPKVLAKVTAEDVMNVAKKYFANEALFISQPSENVDLMVN